MFGKIGLTEVLIVLAIVLIFFGGKKLPELAKGLGEALSQFRKSFESDDEKKSKKT